MSLHSESHITLTHYCGHIHTYRHGHEWPEYRPCFACAQAISNHLHQRISPHIRTQAGRFAVLAIFHEHLEAVYQLAYSKRALNALTK